ncbi:hypothetical protein [Methanocalculus sp.]|nr:hypothetical protein [Methanocalculus sp.]MDG6250474.1 hypothetical protein [Methanocalculus sp.]
MTRTISRALREEQRLAAVVLIDDLIEGGDHLGRDCARRRSGYIMQR